LGALSSDWRAGRGLRTAVAAVRLCKLGQLILAHGVWQGKQIVPARFLAQATTPQINGQQLYFYGYQFWLGRSFVHGREIDRIAAVGLCGQRIFVVPALDLVAVINAVLYRSPLQARVPLDMLNDYVFAAAKP
jgi:CubicO group peptidase (beta-lactamase class C family)